MNNSINFNNYSSFNSSYSVKNKTNSYNYYDVVKHQYANKAPSTSATSGAGSASATQAYQVKGQGEDLAKILSNLKSSSLSSPLNKVSAKSENTDLVTVDNSKSTANATSRDMSIQIDKIATAQVNSGSAVQAKDKAVASSPANKPYQFEINIGDKTSTFSLDITDEDDNNSIQTKMAKAINNANIGVSAAITTKDGATKLSVSSKQTGVSATGDFTVNDLNGGTLASAMGITTKSQDAQDAQYRVNIGTMTGALQTSSSNTIDVGYGVKATLKGASATAVKVNFEKDATAAVDSAKELIKSLNTVLSSADGNGGRGSTRLANDIVGMNKSYSASLSRVGIDVKSDGSLAIDEKKLTKAATDGSLQKLLKDDLGFTRRASNIASNMKSGSFYANPIEKSSGYGVNYSSQYNNSLSLLNMTF